MLQVEKIESEIKTLENEKILCGSDYQKLIDITKEQEDINNKIEEKIARWEYLNELNEQMIKERLK